MLGDEPAALNELADRARTAREKAGVTTPLEVWTMMPTRYVSPGGDAAAVRAGTRAHSYSVAHFAFAQTYESKHVPVEWQADIDERLAKYDYEHHAVFSDDNPNHLLFEDRPEIEEYLLDRMFFVGTPAEVGQRLEELIDAANLDGVWLHAQTVDDVEQAAAAVSSYLEVPASA